MPEHASSGYPLLATVRDYRAPFEFFTCESAIGADHCHALEALFAAADGWTEHSGSFYQVRNCDVTSQAPADLRRQLAERVSRVTGLALSSDVGVTLQRMEPGQQIGLHCDRPLLGYETVRVVVHLNRQWGSDNGGLLRTHPGEDPNSFTHEFSPDYDDAFGFVMRANSHHSVTRVHRRRDSAVFNLWHIGNTKSLKLHVDRLFSGMHFRDLPTALAPVASAAEDRHDEDTTYRAGCVATVLSRWGYPVDVVVKGYRSALSSRPPQTWELQPHTGPTPTTRAVVMARWAAQLFVADYEVTAWQRLARVVTGHPDEMTPAQREFLGAAFGEPAEGRRTPDAEAPG